MTFAITMIANPQHRDRPPRSRTWQVSTTSGHTTTGYLPAWAEDDPSQTGVSVGRFGKVLADICHSAVFSGQSMRVATDGSTGMDAVILGGSIEFHPYTGNPEATVTSAGVPVAHLQIIEDYWMHDLDPWALATIAAKLRTQADYLDHQIRPALQAARADWATNRAS